MSEEPLGALRALHARRRTARRLEIETVLRLRAVDESIGRRMAAPGTRPSVATSRLVSDLRRRAALEADVVRLRDEIGRLDSSIRGATARLTLSSARRRHDG